MSQNFYGYFFFAPKELTKPYRDAVTNLRNKYKIFLKSKDANDLPQEFECTDLDSENQNDLPELIERVETIVHKLNEILKLKSFDSILDLNQVALTTVNGLGGGLVEIYYAGGWGYDEPDDETYMSLRYYDSCGLTSLFNQMLFPYMPNSRHFIKNM